MKQAHQAFCVLESDHYGPCAPTESEFYVTNNDGIVVWRLAMPAYSETNSEYREALDACIAAAFRFGFLPCLRHHSRFTEAVEWPIEVREATEGGDLLLTLPMGTFRLNAKRAKKGDLTSEVKVLFGGSAVGFGVAPDDTPEPVKIFGRVCKPNQSHSKYWFQPSSIEYVDGTTSGYLGSYPRDLIREEAL